MIDAVNIIIEGRGGIIYFIAVAERIVSVVNKIAVIVIGGNKPIVFQNRRCESPRAVFNSKWRTNAQV